MPDTQHPTWARVATQPVQGHRTIVEWNLRERCTVQSIEPDGAKLPVAMFTNAEDARRAVACVNACWGISTENLEAQVGIFDAAGKLADERDTALERVAHLEGLLQRVRQDTEWSCMPVELQNDIEAAIGPRPPCSVTGNDSSCNLISNGTGSKCTTCGETFPF